MGEVPTPQDLVRDAVRGDPQALETLVRRHYEPVWRTLWRFTRDRDAADSLCQEAFLRAIEGLGGYRGDAALGTWITRIGLNLALNEARRSRPRALAETDPAARDGGPPEAAEGRETASTVRDAVDRLPDDLRAALLLTAFTGLTHREAAEHLGCAEGTVSWRVFEAKRRLREVLPHAL